MCASVCVHTHHTMTCLNSISLGSVMHGVSSVCALVRLAIAKAFGD